MKEYFKSYKNWMLNERGSNIPQINDEMIVFSPFKMLKVDEVDIEGSNINETWFDSCYVSNHPIEKLIDFNAWLELSDFEEVDEYWSDGNEQCTTEELFERYIDSLKKVKTKKTKKNGNV